MTNATGLGLVHARYIIAVGDFGVTLYSEDARGQWDATGLNPVGGFPSVNAAADHVRALPHPQTSIEIVSRVSPAVILGASADQQARWYSTNAESVPVHLRHVDAYTLAKDETRIAKLIDPESDEYYTALANEPDAPDIDDSVRFCPECETPNQFGELCEHCQREIESESNQ